MARDYGKHNKKPANKPPSLLLWVLASFLIGYLTATIVDVKSLTGWVNRHVLAEKSDVPPKVKRVVEQKPELPKPKFEFYTLLSKDNSAPVRRTPPPDKHQSASAATVPQAVPNLSPVTPSLSSESVKPTPPVTQSKPVTASSESYMVQIAAFNKRQDAERLKAVLALKGFDVNIVTVSQNNASWYRVVVGPYRSKAEAEKARLDVARTEHIKGIIRKLDA